MKQRRLLKKLSVAKTRSDSAIAILQIYVNVSVRSEGAVAEEDWTEGATNTAGAPGEIQGHHLLLDGEVSRGMIIALHSDVRLTPTFQLQAADVESTTEDVDHPLREDRTQTLLAPVLLPSEDSETLMILQDLGDDSTLHLAHQRRSTEEAESEGHRHAVKNEADPSHVQILPAHILLEEFEDNGHPQSPPEVPARSRDRSDTHTDVAALALTLPPTPDPQVAMENVLKGQGDRFPKTVIQDEVIGTLIFERDNAAHLPVDDQVSASVETAILVACHQ